MFNSYYFNQLGSLKIGLQAENSEGFALPRCNTLNWLFSWLDLEASLSSVVGVLCECSLCTACGALPHSSPCVGDISWKWYRETLLVGRVPTG